jgi:hypothetical protein
LTPLFVQSPVVVDRAGFAALLVQQVLREELVDRLIHRDFAVPPVLGEPVSADFCDEGSKRPCRLGLGVGLDGAVQATYSAICVPAGGDGELRRCKARQVSDRAVLTPMRRTRKALVSTTEQGLRVVPPLGLEPRTCGLRVRCSAS